MAATDQVYETLLVEMEGSVAVVSINNPPMNVINLTMGRDLLAFSAAVARDENVRAVLFRSASEGVFIAGADISMLAELSGDEADKVFAEVASLMDAVAAIPQPTVAALAGTTLGGGFEFALACDFRLMADGFGEIGLPEVRLGLLPGGGGTQRLPRLVGAGLATEMLMKGMRYDAKTALSLGIVHKIYAPDALDAEARKYASSLAAQAPLALRHIKRLITAAFETPGQAGLELERELFLDLARSSDAQEGISAFFEGRKPAFTGK
ncbi:MAG: enoyl-CoA hydratase/isomerase family protein [Thermoleophilia bacterium]|nr:enoyl-CoA hydratase/isomerase family protein [Thermoleophilia bacterium]